MNSADGPNRDDSIIIGRVGAPFGVAGWVHVQSFTQPKSNLLDYPNWQLQATAGLQPVAVEAVRPHGAGFVAKFAHIADRDQACTVTNLPIVIDRSALPSLEADEYYWHDLVGCSVTNLEGERLGRIAEMLEGSGNDVMVVVGDKRHLIPFIPQHFVKGVDLQQHQITVDWSEEVASCG